MDENPAAPGAYWLVIELDAALDLDLPRRAPARLAPGRYVYCGSAFGPGGIRARVARHRKRDKAVRWHIDRLTAVGRVVAVRAEPGGRECDLVAEVLARPGASVPVAGFGSSDCRRCAAHLVRLPQAGGAHELATNRSLRRGRRPSEAALRPHQRAR
jgi:Uri superfamily endonuclease